jgi:hypothetical protein
MQWATIASSQIMITHTARNCLSDQLNQCSK